MREWLRGTFFDGTQFWQRSSFAQWLLGALLTMAAGLLLYAMGSPKQGVPPPSVAKAGTCLQAAGSDLKHSELLARDPSCTCSAAN
jgi:hypothetical protein